MLVSRPLLGYRHTWISGITARPGIRACRQIPVRHQRELGPVLAQLEVAITASTTAEHVYIARFSEGLLSVHFHLFPRSRDIAAEFAKENPVEAGVNGPLLFSWARRQCYVATPDMLSRGTIAKAVRIGKLCAVTGA